MRILFNNHKKLILIMGGIALYLALTVPFLQNMPITDDEVQFAEPAYNFIQYGDYGTSSLSGLFDFQAKTLWQHPLFLALMYFPIKLFGYSFWSIKIWSVFIGLLALTAAYKIGSQFDMPNLYPAMLSLNILFIVLAKIGRMEILTLALSLTTFYWAFRKKHFLAGLSSALAILTHPVGIFTVINALMVYGYHREISRRYFVGLALPLLVAGAFLLGDLEEFYRQYFLVQNYLYSARGLLGGPGTQLQNLQTLLERALPWLKWEMPLFGLFSWAMTQKQDRIQRLVIIIMAVNLMGLVLFIPNKYINYYTALVIPYLVLFIAMSVNKHRTIPVVAVLAITLAVNGLVAGKVTASYMNLASDIPALESLIEPGARVLGPVPMGIALPDRQVIGVHVVKMVMDLEGKTAEEALADLNPDYLVVDTVIAVEQQWRLFTPTEDEFAAFLRQHTDFCGKTYFNGDMIYVFKFKR